MKLLLTTIAAVLLVGCGKSDGIWAAAEEGDVEAVKGYLAIDVNVDARDEVHAGTPLHFAAFRGRKEVAELLINEGADVNAKNQADATPLDKAIEKNWDETVDLLYKHGGKTGKELKAADYPERLTDKEVADLFTEDIGMWAITGKNIPTNGDPERFEDILEIRWQVKGESTVAKFSPTINGEKVPFVGYKEYDANEGIFIWRSKGEGLQETVSRERYDRKAKTYHGESTFPDGAKEASTFEIVGKDKRLFKSQVEINDMIVFSREAILTRIMAGSNPPTGKAPDISIHEAVEAGNIESVKQALADGANVNAKNEDGVAQKEPSQLVQKFWFAYSYKKPEPGYRLWERHNNGVWVETYPSGFQSKYKEEERTIVNGASGDVVVKESGNISKTRTRDGSYRVFIPDYDKTKLLPLYNRYGGKKKDGKWTSPWRKTQYKVEIIQTRDGKTHINEKELADLLRKHGFKTADWLKAGDSIHIAAKAGHIEAVKKHLADGTGVNAIGEFRKASPLYMAAYSYNAEATKFLLENGADVDQLDFEKETALHTAAYHSYHGEGDVSVVALLVDHGSKINAISDRGLTPLDLAIMAGTPEVADLLRKHGGKTGEELKAEGK